MTTVASQTFTLPNKPGTTYDANTYIVLEDKATGDFVHSSTGAVSASNTWANAAIATAAHAQNTATFTATLPALDSVYNYIMRVWTGTNYSTADTLQAGPWEYDALSNNTFTDTNPITNYQGKNAVKTREQ